MAKSDSYTLTGHGKTSKLADKDLRSKKSELTKRLGDADVNTSLSVQETTYQGHFTIKSGMEVPCPDFTVRSREGWPDLMQNAKEQAGNTGLKPYEPNLTVEETYSLTQEQMDAATGRKTRSTPAGITPNQTPSYLNAFTR